MEKILVTGAGGFVGSRILHQCKEKTLCCFPKGFLRTATEQQVQEYLLREQPDIILHTAAISDTGYCARHPEEGYRANVQLPVWLANAARHTGVKLVAFSSDQVYAGVQQLGALSEELSLCPNNVYGRYKLEMEQRVSDLCPDAVLLRASWMYDLPGDALPIRGNLPLNLLHASRQGETAKFSCKDHRGVTYVRHAVELLKATVDLPGGVYNFGSENTEDMVTTARQFAEMLGISVQIEPQQWNRNLAMDTAKLRRHGIYFDSTQQGLCRCLNEHHFTQENA